MEAGTPDVPDGGDAGASFPLHPELCQGLVLGGKVAEEFVQAGPAAVPLGGRVVAGTYAGEEFDIYGSFDAGAPDDGGEGAPGVMATGRTVTSTLVVTGTTLQIVEAFGTVDGGLGAPMQRAYTYTVNDKSLDSAQQCPTATAKQPIGFSAVGGSFALFPDANHRQVYRLQP